MKGNKIANFLLRFAATLIILGIGIGIGSYISEDKALFISIVLNALGGSIALLTISFGFYNELKDLIKIKNKLKENYKK